MLSRILEHREVAVGFRELHNEELRNFPSSPDARVAELVGHVAQGGRHEKCVNSFSW